MDKKGTEKTLPWPFDLLCCLLRVYSKYSNRAVSLIQQSCISNTLIEQSPHIAYTLTKKLNRPVHQKLLILKGSMDLNDKKL